MKITQNVWQNLSHQMHVSKTYMWKAAIAVAMLVMAVVTPLLMALDLCLKPFQWSSKTVSVIAILDFYRGGRNDKGVTLEEVWSWDDTRLEAQHDFIQWLFPLKERGVNPTASLTDDKTITAFKGDKRLQEKMLKSLKVMLKFYGFSMDASGQIAMNSKFGAKSKNWLNLANHNYRRITRILHCLCLHGLKPHAEAFLKALGDVHEQHSSKIGSDTYSLWVGAVH